MADLLWGERQRPARGPKPGLSLERIVHEAIGLVDSEGLAALSMKTLAARLGAGTMSLYRYLPGKEELVSLMFDTAVGAPPDLAGLSWRDALGRWARGNLVVFHEHSWMLSVVGGQRTLGPNEMAWAEAAVAAMSGLALTAKAKLDTLSLVNGYVRGAAQLSAPQGVGPVIDIEAMASRWEEYPAFKAAITDEDVRDPRSEETFEFGLERVLDGIEQLVRR